LDVIELRKTYMLVTGEHKVVKFYTEDGIKKVQSQWRPLNPNNLKLSKGDPLLKSMPPHKFDEERLQYDGMLKSWERDQAARRA